MTKAQVVDVVASKCGCSKRMAGEAVDAMIGAVRGALAKGEKVTFTGFGTFMVRSRKERMGRNPQTGAPLRIPAGKVPAFSAGKALKKAVK